MALCFGSEYLLRIVDTNEGRKKSTFDIVK